jgi:hypothetical protein
MWWKWRRGEGDVLVKLSFEIEWKFTLMASKNKVAALREVALLCQMAASGSWHESSNDSFSDLCRIAGFSETRRIGKATKYMA